MRSQRIVVLVVVVACGAVAQAKRSRLEQGAKLLKAGKQEAGLKLIAEAITDLK